MRFNSRVPDSRSTTSQMRGARPLSRAATFIFTIFATHFSGSATSLAADDLVVKTSSHSVSVTLDKIAAALEKNGITIFARVDHAAGAKKAGMTLAPTELLIFGNPKLGTPLMQSNRTIGIDLPVKVLAWQEDDGTVKVAYTAPAALAKRHHIESQEKVIALMTKALDALTDNVQAQP